MSDGNFDNLTVTGNVGIGTTTPNAKLTIAIPPEKYGEGISLSVGDEGKAVALITNNGQGSWNSLTQTGDHLLLWKGANIDDPGAGFVIAPWRNGPSGIRIDANGDLNVSGNVGIGTANPGAKLEVCGKDDGHSDVLVTGRFMSNSVHGGGLFCDSEDTFVGSDLKGGVGFSTASKWQFVVSKDGNVGIGTTSPAAKLEINGDVRIGENNLYLRSGSDTFHGVGWYGAGKLFANNNVDGPVIFGFHGGALGTTTDGNQKIALNWNSSGIQVTGDITATGDVFLLGADCAEDFNIAGVDKIEAGTVMVICQDGALRPSQESYDKRVAGVISGAGDFRSGIVLDKQAHDTGTQRRPLALVGKVFCKVDAKYSPIEVGDLLTTSPTPGHGMKAGDPAKAFGTVFGKALRGLESGQGLIPILIALQ